MGKVKFDAEQANSWEVGTGSESEASKKSNRQIRGAHNDQVPFVAER